jgi:hypothetical protein
MALPCATCGEPAYETDVGDGQYYCQACFMAFEDELQAPSVSREEPQLLGRRCWPLHTQAVEAAEEQRRRQRLAGADSDSDDAEPGASSLAAARAARAKARASVSSGSSAAAGASSDSMQQQQQLECLVCCDTVASESAMALCGKAEHRFCSDCCWRGCESALGDGLVPACPFDGKERKCGAVGKPTAVAALTHWLGAAGVSSAERSRRKAALGSWGVRGSAKAGFTSTKLDEVYLSAERARSGAVQCIGRPCKSGLRACPAFYVPPVPHSLEPQRVQCTRAQCGASFCAACRLPFHRRSSCAEALRLHAKWVAFLNEYLPVFLKVASAADAERWAPVLTLHAKAKGALDEATRDTLEPQRRPACKCSPRRRALPTGALDEATRDTLSRFDELRKMELWKAKHCKRCPHCKRVRLGVIGGVIGGGEYLAECASVPL